MSETQDRIYAMLEEIDAKIPVGSTEISDTADPFQFTLFNTNKLPCDGGVTVEHAIILTAIDKPRLELLRNYFAGKSRGWGTVCFPLQYVEKALVMIAEAEKAEKAEKAAKAKKAKEAKEAKAAAEAETTKSVTGPIPPEPASGPVSEPTTSTGRTDGTDEKPVDA